MPSQLVLVRCIRRRRAHLRVDDPEIDHGWRVQLGVVCGSGLCASDELASVRKGTRRTSRRLCEEDLTEDARDDGPKLEELEREERQPSEHDVGHEEVARFGERVGELIEDLGRRLGDVLEKRVR